MACFKSVSTIRITGISSAAFWRFFPSSKSLSLTDFIPPTSFLIMSPNSASKVFEYCLNTCFMPSGVVSRGRIFRFAFFLIKSIVPKSSGSNIATSSSWPFFLNATILWERAMGSGMSLSISGAIFSSARFTKGMPKM